jgi:hypothetical protein
MIPFSFTVKQAKDWFFDRSHVLNAMGKETARVMSKFGAFVRRDAKGSIRRRKRASAPGQPPSSHTGLLRDFIFFASDTLAKSVVIGPARLNGRGIAPALLEYGGKRVDIARLITVKTKGGGTRQVTIPAGTRSYAPRPFMQPAFDLNIKKMDRIWSGKI